MKNPKCYYPLFLVLIVSLLLTACEKEALPAPTANRPITASLSLAAAPALPANWTAVQSGNGVVLGRRIYSRSGSNSTDYALLVDLAAGATIKLRQGSNAIATTTAPSPSYPRKILASSSTPSWYWPTYAGPKSFAMVNLQFFNFYTGALSFPIKGDGTLISCGSSNNESNAKRKLGINGSTIVVADYLNTSNAYSNVAANLISPTVVVGLHPNVSKSPSSLTGRVYLGYKNSTLVIYATGRATQAQVRSIMTTEFALNDASLVMFDGSGSTQLVCRGTTYINSFDNRPIPNIMEILEY
jgi:hypothetical protein